VTDSGLGYINTLKGLRLLDLSGCKVSNGGLRQIKFLAKLEVLKLNFCTGVTDEGLAHLSPLTNLRSLELQTLETLTDSGLRQLRDLRKLQSLDLALKQAKGPRPKSQAQPCQRVPVLTEFLSPALTEAGL
jgi:hypothetical protein